MRDTIEKSTELHHGPDKSSLPIHVGLDVHKESIVAAIASWRPGGLAISVDDAGQIRNGVVRRLLTESVRTYRYSARETRHLQRKAAEASEYARQRAWAAQKRLCHRYTAG